PPLPPPGTMDSPAVREAVTHMLGCSCAMCFSAAASSEKFHGSMNLASNTASHGFTQPSSRGCHPAVHGMKHLPLHLGDGLAGVSFIPVPVEVLGRTAELDYQVAGEIL